MSFFVNTLYHLLYTVFASNPTTTNEQNVKEEEDEVSPIVTKREVLPDTRPDYVEYKSSCPLFMQETLSEIEELDKSQHERREDAFKEVLRVRAPQIYQAILTDLFSIIRTSPELDKKIQNLLKLNERLDVKNLIAGFENNLPAREWVVVTPEQGLDLSIRDGFAVDHFEESVFADLLNQLKVMEELLVEGDQKKFFVNMAALRCKSPNKDAPGKTSWILLKGLYYLAVLSLRFTPTLIMASPILFPKHYVQEMQLLLTAFQNIFKRK